MRASPASRVAKVSTGIVPSTFFDGTVTVSMTSSPRRRASTFSTAAGTCTIGGACADEELSLRQTSSYFGRWKCDGIRLTYLGIADAFSIDWSKVPMPEDATKTSEASRVVALDAAFGSPAGESLGQWLVRVVSRLVGQEVKLHPESNAERALVSWKTGDPYERTCNWTESAGRSEAHIKDLLSRARWLKEQGPQAQSVPAPRQCRECSRPERQIAATHGELCVYCSIRNPSAEHARHPFDEAEIARRMETVQRYREDPARARMAAADRKAQPRATAESRMLALPHPCPCT